MKTTMKDPKSSVSLCQPNPTTRCHAGDSTEKSIESIYARLYRMSHVDTLKDKIDELVPIIQSVQLTQKEPAVMPGQTTPIEPFDFDRYNGIKRP